MGGSLGFGVLYYISLAIPDCGEAPAQMFYTLLNPLIFFITAKIGPSCSNCMRWGEGDWGMGVVWSVSKKINAYFAFLTRTSLSDRERDL